MSERTALVVPSVEDCRKVLRSAFLQQLGSGAAAPPPRSVQVAGVVLERRQLHAVPQPLDLQVLEVIVLVVLNDDPLQFADFALHPGTKLSLHLQQGLLLGFFPDLDLLSLLCKFFSQQ